MKPRSISALALAAAAALSGAALAQGSPAPAVPGVPAVPAAPAVAPRPHPVAAPTPLHRLAPLSHPRRVPTEEEALALVAMEGLMSQPPERAMPILKRVLTGEQSPLVKERALFVLSQFNLPEAQALLLDVARSSREPHQLEAIRMIAIGGNAKSLAALNEIHAAGNEAVKHQVLKAWMIAGNKADVYQVALNAKTDAEAAQAIRLLATMGAQDELRKLGAQRKHSASLLEAYAISGDVASLRKIAEGGGEVSLRAEATRRIGIAGNDAARAALREIYASAKAAEIRDAALQGLMIAGDQQGVLALYRAAKNIEEKRALLRTLSIMGGDAALAAIDAALETKK
ncbi:MAG: hypothetical protein JNJ55_06595 [Betaproteobacteria bacterium]|nr:hypothetical protein [Betaproteobacteria bacterium]